MFGSIGITELIVLAGVALMILGPEKFPEFAKIAARTWRDLRGYVQDVQRDLTKEIRPVRDELDKLSRMDPERYIEKLTESSSEESQESDDASGEDEYNPEPAPYEDYTVDGTFEYDAYATAEKKGQEEQAQRAAQESDPQPADDSTGQNEPEPKNGGSAKEDKEQTRRAAQEAEAQPAGESTQQDVPEPKNGGSTDEEQTQPAEHAESWEKLDG